MRQIHLDLVHMSIEEQRKHIGSKVGVSSWLLVDQTMIDRFAEVTLDPDPMHIDPHWSQHHSPFVSTVAFGFLTVSLLTHLYHDVLRYDRYAQAHSGGYPLNYGFDRLRLIAPVPVDARVRGHFVLLDLRAKGEDEVVHHTGVEIEIEGRNRPALVCEWLAMWVTGAGHERLRVGG
jgi:acyl dehydratase